MNSRRCLWPGCGIYLRRSSSAEALYCSAHHQALGSALAERLRKTYGTVEWLEAVQSCQAHARATIAFVRSKVQGGQHADSDAAGE